MSPETFYGLIAVGLFSLALHALVVHRHLLRRIIAANVMGSAVFMLLVAMARRGAGADPVPHAMVLTGIVVAVAATGLAVVLLRRIHAETGRTHLPEDDGGKD